MVRPRAPPGPNGTGGRGIDPGGAVVLDPSSANLVRQDIAERTPGPPDLSSSRSSSSACSTVSEIAPSPLRPLHRLCGLDLSFGAVPPERAPVARLRARRVRLGRGRRHALTPTWPTSPARRFPPAAVPARPPPVPVLAATRSLYSRRWSGWCSPGGRASKTARLRWPSPRQLSFAGARRPVQPGGEILVFDRPSPLA